MNARTLVRRLVVSGLLCAPAARLPAQPSAPPPPCSRPEYRQFDFWLGDWDVFDAGEAKPSMRIRVEKILDGCALRESYRDDSGKMGESYNIWDASRKVWHQTWVTNRGQLLMVDARMQDGSMVFDGPIPAGNGPPDRIRVVFKPEAGGVRQTAETSPDGGKTWRPLFDMTFRPHR